MLTAVASTSAARDRNVGLGLGLVVERDGTLRPHQPARLERSAESVLHESDRRVVGAVLGLAHDELAAQELEGLVRAEDADVDHALVLRGSSAACGPETSS
jgi:diphthamide biosynthesis methyltransferase